jgi:hypothetical protein
VTAGSKQLRLEPACHRQLLSRDHCTSCPRARILRVIHNRGWLWWLASTGGVAAERLHRTAMKTLDEMLSLNLLSTVQHAEIAAWIAQARTPERIMQMPAPLWRSLELASVLLDVDADLLQPPLLQATM